MQNPVRAAATDPSGRCVGGLQEPSATTDDSLDTLAAPGPLATRKEMRSTPLRGGLPAETHISPFPEDDDILPSNARVKDWPRVERPRAGSQAEKNGQNVCSTKECKETADELMAAMNTTANPCDDFYAYTCGNWIKANPIPPTSNVMTMINKLRLELNLRVKEILSEGSLSNDSASVLDAKNMFAACVDNATLESLGLSPLTSLMENHGGWPMAMGEGEAGDPDWQETAAALIREVTLNTLVTAYVGPDDMDTNNSVLYLDQSILGLTGRDFYLEPSLQSILDAYAELLKGTARLVRDWQGSGVGDDAIDEQGAEVIAFEKALAEIVVPSSDRRNTTARYNRLSLADLQNATDAGAPGVIRWTNFLNSVFSGVNVTWNSSNEVVCYATDFMSDLADLLNRTPKRTIANYLHWRLVYAVGDETNEAMRDLFFNYSKIVSGINEPPAREDVCAGLVNSMMGMAVGSVYVSESFPATAKEE
ncbi:unnamed protein product, partial [Darwinula stevensoni]